MKPHCGGEMKETFQLLQNEHLQKIPQVNQFVDNRKNFALPLPLPDSLQANQVSKLLTTIFYRKAIYEIEEFYLFPTNEILV